MPIFDLHSDIIHGIIKDRVKINEYFRGKNKNKVCYAMFVPEHKKHSEQYFDSLISIKREIERLDFNPIFSIENIPEFAFTKFRNEFKNIKYVSLCHNYSNNLCDSSTDDRTNKMLSNAGIEMVKTMNDNDIMMDISHASDECSYHIIDISNLPIIASHSNCEDIFSDDRNLTRLIVHKIAQSGGLIGLTFLPRCLGSYYEDKIIDHINYLKNEVGKHHIAIGTDFYGGAIETTYEKIINTIDNNDILFNNAERVIK